MIACLAAGSVSGQAQECVSRGEHPMPALSEATRMVFERRLDSARRDLEARPGDANAMIWVGRRLAYLGRYHEAIHAYTEGARRHPRDARFLRHRGHRWITLRCLDSAVSDLTRAARMVEGTQDAIEPDGLPNERNIPTSTLQTNIWYHLGLALYLQGRYGEALKAYRRCLRLSDNNDMLVATANWYHLTLLKLQRLRAASRFRGRIDPTMPLIENTDYLSILNLYIRNMSVEEALKTLQDKGDLSLASYGYGLGEYLMFKGNREAAGKVFSTIVSGTANWGSFGFMAADRALQAF